MKHLEPNATSVDATHTARMSTVNGYDNQLYLSSPAPHFTLDMNDYDELNDFENDLQFSFEYENEEDNVSLTDIDEDEEDDTTTTDDDKRPKDSVKIKKTKNKSYTNETFEEDSFDSISKVYSVDKHEENVDKY